MSICVSVLIAVVLGSFALGGCAVIDHLPELQTMAEFSRDKNVQHADITRENAAYDMLTAVIKAGKIKEYPDKTAVLRNFGKPVLRQPWADKGEVWLYRYAVPQTAKHKTYLYFDHEDRLINYQQEDIQW